MENDVNIVGMVISAWLENWMPADTPPSQSAETDSIVILKTSEDIVADLSDMIDATTGDVALMMAAAGYSIRFRPDGRHGWAMSPRRK